MRKALSTLVLGTVILSGCSIHKTDFSCKNGKGMGCRPMTEIYESIQDKTFESKVASANGEGTTLCKSCQKANNAPKQELTSTALQAKTYFQNQETVYRTEDKVMRIWFNSYFDQNNNFQGSQYVYTVIEPAMWVAK